MLWPTFERASQRGLRQHPSPNLSRGIRQPKDIVLEVLGQVACWRLGPHTVLASVAQPTDPKWAGKGGQLNYQCLALIGTCPLAQRT